MAQNKFGVDLSGMTREIQDINKALEQLGMVAQGIFSNIGRAADMFGGKMNNLQSGQRQATAGDMLTPNGQAGMSEASERLREAMILQQKMTNNPQGYLVNAEAQIMNRHVGAAGTTYSYAGFTQDSLKSTIAQSQAAARQSQQAQFSGIITPFSAPQNDVPKPAFGYGQKDLPRILGMSQDVSGINASISKLSGSIGPGDQVVSNALNTVKSDLLRQNDIFLNQLQRYQSAAPDTDAQRNAFSELTRTMKSLEKAVDEANEIQKDSQRFAGGNGGNGGGAKNLWSQLKEFGETNKRELFGAMGLAVTAGSTYFAGETALRSATAGQGMNLMQAQAGLAQSSFGASMAANDMTKAENLLMYRGDMLFPGQFNYLGKGGMGRAMDTAGDMRAQQMALLNSQRALGMMGGAGQIISGIGMGLGVGAMSGGLGMMAGAGGVMGGINSMINSYVTSPYTAMSGGYEHGVIPGIAGMFGISRRELGVAAQAKRAEYDAQQFSNSQSIRELELQRNPDKLAGTQELLDRVAAQNKAAEMVGGYAPSYNQFDSYNKLSATDKAKSNQAYALENSAGALGRRMNSPRIPLVLSDRRRGFFGASGMDMAEAQASIDDSNGGDFQKSQLHMQTQINEMRDKAGTLKSQVFSGINPATRLGMTSAEFMMSEAGLINVMGSGIGANSGNTSRLLSMSKSGLGSYDSLLGGIAGLNKVSGGQDNFKQLESIMAAGVSAGFDKSRVATQFVATTTELTRALNITSADSVARNLSFSASAMSGTGRADEKSLAYAAKGAADLASFTGSSSGVQGTMKMMGAYGAGGSIGSGAGLLTASSTEQLADYQRQLESGNITDPRLKSIVALSGGTAQALQQVKGSLSGSTVGLRGSFDMMMQNSQIAKKYGVRTSAELLDKARGMTGSARASMISDVVAMGKEMAASSGGTISEEAGAGFGSYLLRSGADYSSGSDTKNLDRAINKGLAMSINPAQTHMREYVEKLYQQTRGDMGNSKITRKEYMNYAEAGGSPIASVNGRQLDSDTLKSMEAKAAKGDTNALDFLKKADNEIEKIDRYNLANNASQSLAAMQNTSRVFVTNLYEISAFLKPLDGKMALNQGNG